MTTAYEPPTVEEVREKLAAAIAKGARYVYLDSKRDRWGIDATTIGVAQGWLTQGVMKEIDEQYSQMRFDFTDKARDELGLKN